MLRMYGIEVEARERFRLAHALFLMGKMAETGAVMDWLRKEIKRLDAENRSERDEVLFRQRQGVCQAIANLLHEIDRADETASTIQKEMVPNYQL